MNIIGIFLVSPFWGCISTQLFLQSWLAFFGVIINVIGLIRGKVKRNNVLTGLGVSLFQIILFVGLLRLGQFLLTDIFLFGYTNAENIVYWIFAALSFIYAIVQFPSKIHKTWRNANVPGSLEEDITKRKINAYTRKLFGDQPESPQ